MSDYDRWTWLCVGLGANNSAPIVYNELVDAYKSPVRAYHNIGHVADCLDKLRECEDYVEFPDVVELAIWFHDAIYEPTNTSGLNEECSAEFACTSLDEMGIPSPIRNYVEALILLTKHTETPVTDDGKIMVDIDLSILAAPKDVFDRYEEAIWKEYEPYYSVEKFRSGRLAFIDKMLGKHRIFSSDLFRDKYEERARANLLRSWNGLSGSE